MPLPALLLLFVVVAGTNWSVLDLALAHAGPFALAALSSSGAAVLLFVVLALRGELRWPGRGEARLVLGVGAVQIALFSILAFLGLAEIGAGRAAMLVYTTPLWVAAGARLFLAEPISGRKRLAVAVGLAGVVALAAPGPGAEPGSGLGMAILVAAALCWATGILLVKAQPSWRLSPLQLAPWQLAVAASLLAPAVLAFESAPIAWSPVFLACLSWNVVVGTAFGVWAGVTLARALPAVTMAMATLWIPVVALATSALALGETLSARTLASLALITLGNALAVREDRRLAAARSQPQSSSKASL